MKTLILLFGLLFAQLSLAGSDISKNPFSAFVFHNTLYITIIGDSCNKKEVALAVGPACDKARKNTNVPLSCDAEFEVISTRMGCADKPTATVLNIDLAKTKLEPAAKSLRLRMKDGEDVVELKIYK